MFSMFPDGSPGAGLLLLRAAGGAVLITQGAAYLRDKNESGFLALIVVSVTCVVGLLLLIGFLTRMAALVAAVIGVNSLLALVSKVNAPPLVTTTNAPLVRLIAISF